MLKPTRKPGIGGAKSIARTDDSADRETLKSRCNFRPLRRAEDIRSAQLWLGSGAPIADVLTMLETGHRFDLSQADCRTYAVEILWAAQGLSRPQADLISNPKEFPYAAA